MSINGVRNTCILIWRRKTRPTGCYFRTSPKSFTFLIEYLRSAFHQPLKRARDRISEPNSGRSGIPPATLADIRMIYTAGWWRRTLAYDLSASRSCRSNISSVGLWIDCSATSNPCLGRETLNDKVTIPLHA